MAIKGRSGNVISGNFCGNEALPKDRDFRRHNHAVTCLASREGEPTERERWGRRQKCSRGAWGLPVCAVQALRSSDAACLLCTSHEHTCIAVISRITGHVSRFVYGCMWRVVCGYGTERIYRGKLHRKQLRESKGGSPGKSGLGQGEVAAAAARAHRHRLRRPNAAPHAAVGRRAVGAGRRRGRRRGERRTRRRR